MTKKPDAAKKADKEAYYAEKAKPYEGYVAELLKYESDVIADCRQTPASAAGKLFNLADKMLNLTAQYLALNGISCAVLNMKNEQALGDARKSLYKAVIYIENVVTGKIDAPFSEYEANFEELHEIDPDQRFRLARKIGLTIDLIKNAYGENTKWRWTFVEVEGRFATITKNLFDLKNAVANTQPGAHGQVTATRHLRLITKLLTQASDNFIERYKFATKRPQDIMSAVRFLGALKYIYSVMGDKENLEIAQKKYDAGNTLVTELLSKQGGLK